MRKKFDNLKDFDLSLHSEEKNADVAQLVEHDLAKVGVAGSSLVFRSQSLQKVEAFIF